MTDQRTVLAVLNDLMFIAKIQDGVKRTKMKAILATTEADALQKAKDEPALIILDLNTTTLDVLQLIRGLKQDAATSGIPLVGFVSHVQTALRQQAIDAGCDQVVARSAFSQNLPAILSAGEVN
jgi:CheY-like chemotaxis protein